MTGMVRTIAAGLALWATMMGGPVQARDNGVTPQAQWMARELDRMDVETKWIAGTHVNWKTGLPDGEAEILPGRHTHCSAFVASAAERFGIYILRPPEHRQALLANAQNEWLAVEGRAMGWRPVAGPIEAQNAANRGMLVVASYHNHRDDKPGHIAIVRPGQKSDQEIAEDGPDVIQAGTLNRSSISLRSGFAGHVHAWTDNEIDYYAHAIRPSAGPSNDRQ